MREEWLSITDAAERLTAAGDNVDRSTLSRYLKQHAEALPLRRDGKSNLVEFEALVAHRGENVRLRTAPRAIDHKPGRTQFVGSQADGAARKAIADAELREMDLAERRRELTLVSEVEQGGRDAVALMQSALEQAMEEKARAAALKYGWDERQVRATLRDFGRRGMDVFHREILSALDKIRRGGEDEAEFGVAPAA